MALVRWEPFEGLTTLRREMDRLFEHFFERAPTGDGGMFEPAVEVSETNDQVLIKAQVPGINKDNLHLDVTDDALTLRGEVQEEEKKEDKRFYRREFHYGAFARTIPLPTSVQADKAMAQLKDGMLTVTIPKGERAKTKQIPIRT